MRLSSYVLLLTATLSNSLTAAERDFSDYLMADRQEEVAIARSAAPAAVSGNASVYRLTLTGFELAEQGSNSWHCLVERTFFDLQAGESARFDTTVRAPQCFNAEAADTRMEEIFMRTMLALQGATQERVEQRINAAYASGELRLPDSLAFIYMQSSHQWLGEPAGKWFPHVMIWQPNLQIDEIGSHGMMSGHPIFTGAEGSRETTLVIPTPVAFE